MTLRPHKAAAGGACDESDMTGHARDCFDPTPCPTDLCCFGECQCAPSAVQGDRRRLMMQALGLAAAAMAVAGVVVPLLPTTPFVLVSAWAFARSSPRLEAWLRNHDRLGPPLKAWEQRGAIPRGAKAVAAVSLPVSGLLVHAAGAGLAVTALVGVGLACVGGWILTRPS